MAHIFHISIGVDNCCALIELFPEKKLGFSDVVGFQNIARNIGVYYFRYQCADGSINEEGTTSINVSGVTDLVKDAMNTIIKNSNAKYPEAAKKMDSVSCLNDVKIESDLLI